MSETRPQKQQQYSLVFGPVRKGEAPTPAAGEAEALPAGRPPESPVSLLRRPRLAEGRRFGYALTRRTAGYGPVRPVV